MGDICEQRCFHPDAIRAAREALAVDARDHPEAAAYFKTLGNPQRLRILRALRRGELCVCDIALVLNLSIGAASQQLKLLRDQGWLAMRHHGRMVYYRLRDDAPFAGLAVELEALAADQHGVIQASV